MKEEDVAYIIKNREALLERILSRRKITESGCWEYTGSRSVTRYWAKHTAPGYGTIRIGKPYRCVHRTYWMLVRNINLKKMLCHHCDNPPCFNPDYLYEGDSSQNSRDAYARGRIHLPSQRGSKGNAAKLTEADLLEIRRLVDSGELQSTLARQFGVTQSTISRIKLKKNWGDI